MATETTPASSLARYRPIVLSIASFGAFYCAYLVYNAHRIDAPVPIQRSNAVHRGRRRPRRQSQQEEAPPAPNPAAAINEILPGIEFNESVSLGIWNLNEQDGQAASFDLRLDSLPTAESLRRDYDVTEERAQEILASIHSEFVQRFVMMHLGQDAADVPRNLWLQRWPAIQAWLEERGIPRAQVGRGLTRLQEVIEQQISRNQAIVADDVESLTGTEAGPGGPLGYGYLNPGRGGDLNLKQLLYHIAESQARQEGYLHRGFRCDQCGSTPIRGTRWKCANCPDLDLCNDCHATSLHYKNHIFYEIRIPTYALSNYLPVQDLGYTGHPENMPQSLTQKQCTEYAQKAKMEKSEIEGLYDQFSCLADTPREGDPLRRALDRPTFQQALMTTSARSVMKPSLVFDRLFALFDNDGDGLVSFEEFVMGISFIRSKPKTHERRRRIFKAYDIDGDGFVERKDFLRMFRSLYSLQRDVTVDLMMQPATENALRESTQLVLSSQTLSSAFTEDRIPRGEPRQRRKNKDEFGDYRHQPNQKVVNEDSKDTVEREEIVANAWESHAQFPFDHRTGEALSTRDFLYLAPRDRDGRPANHIARDQRVHFAHNGKPVGEARREAWRERWRRRRFYTDEEEGLVGPDPSAPIEIEIDGYQIPRHEQDLGQDIMYQVVEDGLNELVDPLFKRTEDLALEVERATPELRKWKLDIEIFRTKKREEHAEQERIAQDPLLATAAAAENLLPSRENTIKPTPPSHNSPSDYSSGHSGDPSSPRASRSTLAAAIASIETEVLERPLEEQLQETGYHIQDDNGPLPAEEVLEVSNEEHSHPHSVELDTTVSIPSRTMDANQTSHDGQVPVSPPQYVSDSSIFTPDALPIDYDPTMPQFRPNSEKDLALDMRPADVIVDPVEPVNHKPFNLSEIPAGAPHSKYRKRFEAEIVRQFEHMFLGWERDPDGIVVNGGLNLGQQDGHERTDEHLSETQLRRLAMLQDAEDEIAARRGPGRMSFDEFDSFLSNSTGNDFSFLENWLELCYF